MKQDFCFIKKKSQLKWIKDVKLRHISFTENRITSEKEKNQDAECPASYRISRPLIVAQRCCPPACHVNISTLEERT